MEKYKILKLTKEDLNILVNCLNAMYNTIDNEQTKHILIHGAVDKSISNTRSKIHNLYMRALRSLSDLIKSEGK